LIGALSSRKSWLDFGHLSLEGGQEYTRWLAAHLAEQKIFAN
jgi:hypothetical protein